MDFEKLKFEQFCHRQVKSAILAISKKLYTTGKVGTFKLDTPIIGRIIKNARLAKTTYRYDLELNDQDNSTNVFCLDKDAKKVIKTLQMPVVLGFLFNETPITVHLIDKDLGFISTLTEDIAQEFLNILK